MDFNQYAFDEDLAENGRVVPLGPDASLTICRWGNKKFVKMFTEMTKPYGKNRGFDSLQMDDEDQAEIMMQIVATTILVGWEGMTDNGKKIKYSPENAVKIFKKYDSFLGDVMRVSQDDANFKSETMEAELGNSKTDSEQNSGSADKEKP